DRFAEKTYEEMLQGIAKLKAQGCDRLIVDLRSNSGGFLNVVQAMCNEFLARGEMIVYTEGGHQRRQETRADGTGSCRDMGLTVLIDEYSASASEIFAGAMQDNDRGVIIGRRSFGKGLVQSEMQLGDGSAIRLTVARYHTPSGRCIQRPYGHGDGEYYADIAKRYTSGELFSADSIKADTTDVFYTAKGRKVYGGGGIVPDIFVAYDTATASPYLYNLRAKRVIYDFAKQNVEKLRPLLSSKPMPEMVHYLLKQNYIDGLQAFAAKRGLAKPARLDTKEREVIENEVRAYIAQSINDEGGIYPILNSIDPVVKRALAEMGAESLY
ncbi:MAG: S41 family peptidase, partial [Marinilabiliaceae bacterium]